MAQTASLGKLLLVISTLPGSVPAWASTRFAALPRLKESIKPKVAPEKPRLSPWNLPGKPPHLVAHYMPWFAVQKSATEAARTWSHWKWTGGGVAHDPEKKGDNGRREIASAYYPLIGPYNSWSRAVVRYHLKTAQAAGIQAFLCIWYGPATDTDRQIPLLLEEAAPLGMRIAICYEEKINFPEYRSPESRDDLIKNVAGDLTYIQQKYGKHPAYLKRNGAPFIYQFNGWGSGDIGPQYLTPAEWKKIFARLKSPVVYARQNLDEAYYPTLHGAYQWWTPDATALTRFSTRAAQMVGEGKLKFFMTMACPGFDDSGVWGWGQGPRIFPRAGLSVFKDTFDRAWQGNPEIIQLVTWNDFNEGTVIEPTREFGYRYIDALETWWEQKTHRPVDLHDNRLPFYEYLRTCSLAELAEAPAKPFDEYIKHWPLTIDVPDVLNQAAPKK